MDKNTIRQKALEKSTKDFRIIVIKDGITYNLDNNKLKAFMVKSAATIVLAATLTATLATGHIHYGTFEKPIMDEYKETVQEIDEENIRDFDFLSYDIEGLIKDMEEADDFNRVLFLFVHVNGKSIGNKIIAKLNEQGKTRATDLNEYAQEFGFNDYKELKRYYADMIRNKTGELKQ